VRRAVVQAVRRGESLEAALHQLRQRAGFVPARQQDVDAALSESSRLQLAPLLFGDVGFPPLLAAIPDPPFALFMQGDPAALSVPLSVAIVGSRRAASASLQIARVLAADLARAGIAIVSGLAAGIDGAAHTGALERGAVTVAVIGGGHRYLYPARHRALAQRIVQQGGALLSEYPPTMQPRPAHFPERNRIISGLSAGVVVVEATIRSGSLITARMALEQGREVMAVPGSVLGPGHGGCHRLLKEGAVLVEDAADVLTALGMSATPAPRVVLPQSPALARILQEMPESSVGLHELMGRLNMSAEVLLGAMVSLELDGFVQSTVDGYIRRPQPTGSS
jgi:DNA processing protein